MSQQINSKYLSAREFILKSRCELFGSSYNSRVTEWWLEKGDYIVSALETSNNYKDFFEKVQTNSISGFDHRLTLNDCDNLIDIIAYKQNKLKEYKCFSEIGNTLSESGYSNSTSLIASDGVLTSNIFQSHLSHYLRIKEHISNLENILEIGAGYGALARIFFEQHKFLRYVIIDLQPSLICSYLFLKANFPNLKIIHADLEKNIQEVNFDDNQSVVILVPSNKYELVKNLNLSFDLAINTGSFQEMPQETACGYFELLFNDLKVTNFYSHNYFLNPDSLGNDHERNQLTKTLIPKLSAEYTLTYAMLNNPVYDIDASSRNWLEVVAKISSSSPVVSVQNKALIRSLLPVLFEDKNSFFGVANSYTYFLLFYLGFPIKLQGELIFNNVLGLKDCMPFPSIKLVELHKIISKVNKFNFFARLCMLTYMWATYLLLSPFGLVYFKFLTYKRIPRRGMPTATFIRMREFSNSFKAHCRN